MPITLQSWANNPVEENAMNDDHDHLWEHFINQTVKTDLSKSVVLDYGCNQGGFLKKLFGKFPFKKAVGVDVAQGSLAIARQKLAGIPAEFTTPENLLIEDNRFDVAFSHEALYLLPDLYAHARTISSVLKPGASYYAAIGCHTDNPQWENWHGLISEYSQIPVQNYALDDYANAFFKSGFSVCAKPFQFEGFVPLKHGNPYFPNIRDSLDYHINHKIIFCFTKLNAGGDAC